MEFNKKSLAVVFSLFLSCLALGQNNVGTLVTDPIRPFSVNSTNPSAIANEIKGGPFSSSNLVGLSNIPAPRLEIGAIGYATNTGLYYSLTATNPATWSSINGANFTNIAASNVIGALATNGNGAGLTNLTAANITGTVALANGGTGATNANSARINLELGPTNNVTVKKIILDPSLSGEFGLQFGNSDTGLYVLGSYNNISFRSGGTNLFTSFQGTLNFDVPPTFSFPKEVRQNLELGETNQVVFSNVQVGTASVNQGATNFSIKFDTNTTNMIGISGGSGFPKRIVFHVDGGIVSVFSNSINAGFVFGTGISVGSNGITFDASGIYVTRSNLGLIGTGSNSVIGGGDNNQSSANGSVVGGGENNISSALNSTVSGGRNNTASQSRATVAGGSDNTASGAFSFAAGRRAKATNTGAFVFSDSTDADFFSTNDNSFNIRAVGGMSLDLGTNGIVFRNTTNAAVTRTNLGLGASWLVSTNSPVFVGTNGEVVSPTNFWQVAPIVTRFVEFDPPTNATTNIVAARNLHIHSLAISRTGVTSTIALPTNGAFNGDIALVAHQGPTSSVTAIRQAGAGTNLITLNQPEQAVEFVYYNSEWQFNHNLSYIEPIFFSGTNAAANAAASRTNLGLGASNNVEFNTLAIGGSGQMTIRGSAGNISFYDGVDSENVLFIPSDGDPVEINSQWNDSAVRSNLGLPLAALISTNNANFRTAIELGATNNVSFSNVTASGTLTATGTVTATTNLVVEGFVDYTEARTNNTPTNTPNFAAHAAWIEVKVGTNSFFLPAYQ